jgi:hypothetical protein
MLSFLPICEPLDRVGCVHAESNAATSNAQRVRVLAFSKMRAMFCRAESRAERPPFSAL